MLGILHLLWATEKNSFRVMCSAVGFFRRGTVFSASVYFSQCVYFVRLEIHGLLQVTSSVPSPSGCERDVSLGCLSAHFRSQSLTLSGWGDRLSVEFFLYNLPNQSYKEHFHLHFHIIIRNLQNIQYIPQELETILLSFWKKARKPKNTYDYGMHDLSMKEFV